MKIAITTSGDSLDAAVDPRFGRAKAFILYDTETDGGGGRPTAHTRTAARGPGTLGAAGGVPPGPEAVLTGNCGPRGFATLEAAKVAVYTGASGTVQQAVDAFKAGALQAAGDANVDAHFGTGI